MVSVRIKVQFRDYSSGVAIRSYLFAATGHFKFNYAKKSARMYLQLMLELPAGHPWLYEQFTEHGYHTVRRSDRYWAGLWTDLTIEQLMMRSIKSR